ncbi:hypothetical protein [Anaerocolumna chitinilytica]|uniref:Uncharacterized protein n=1 Tax=Anaerocolumna chitinilytica TaxID=1727145 RepID=A0A7I8DLX6_9FIRM|nr:hypothetical protein [Anaerocolumna chitinilytica]BCJ97286.1 hypothetical protein bsdcttw_03270 [Anaerocolumna chitinilytica]
MKQLKQDQQLYGKQKLKINIKNPNSSFLTAKYLAEIILEELKDRERLHKGKDDRI